MSTIKAFFEGKKQYFDGTIGQPLFIATSERVKWDWAPHPIMHLDLNTQKYESKERLEYVLDEFLSEEEEKYGITGQTRNVEE